ncbi:Rha family transcriptional regulator [Pantoea ananatis]
MTVRPRGSELTGKLHKNVLVDCRNLLNIAGLKSQLSEESYIDNTGRALPLYRLTKKATFVLVSGYSAELRPQK